MSQAVTKAGDMTLIKLRRLIFIAKQIKEPLIDSAAHFRHIFSLLLLAEKREVPPVHLAFFVIAGEKSVSNLYHLIKSVLP